MQNLSQRSDVPFHRGTEKLMKERKTKHDWLKKTNLIVSLDRTRTSFSEPRILRAAGGTKTGRKRNVFGLSHRCPLGWRWSHLDAA
jgi:hypothetical protein